MVRLCLFLSIFIYSSIILGAASSTDVEVSIPKLTLQKSNESGLRRSSSNQTPKLGSRIRSMADLSKFCIDVARIGLVTPNRYDDAQQYIERQFDLVGASTPLTARTLASLKEQLQQDVERHKIVFSQSSSATGESTGSSDERQPSDDDISTPISLDEEDPEQRTLKEMLISIQIANNLLTQSAVRAQDGLERANYDAKVNMRWAYIGAALGVAGLVLSVFFAAISFIPT